MKKRKEGMGERRNHCIPLLISFFISSPIYVSKKEAVRGRKRRGCMGTVSRTPDHFFVTGIQRKLVEEREERNQH